MQHIRRAIQQDWLHAPQRRLVHRREKGTEISNTMGIMISEGRPTDMSDADTFQNGVSLPHAYTRRIPIARSQMDEANKNMMYRGG